MDKDFIPVGLNVKEKRVLIIGAGNVAFRKFLKLREYTCDITIVSKAFQDEFNKYNIFKQERSFNESDLDKADIVFICTDDIDLNYRIAAQCEQKGIIYNNATSRSDMSFKMLSSIEYEGYTITVSKKQNLKETKKFKDELEKLLKKHQL